MANEQEDVVLKLGNAVAAFLGERFGEVIRGKITRPDGTLREMKIDCEGYSVLIKADSSSPIGLYQGGRKHGMTIARKPNGE